MALEGKILLKSSKKIWFSRKEVLDMKKKMQKKFEMWKKKSNCRINQNQLRLMILMKI
jgi:hypothetical protein